MSAVLAPVEDCLGEVSSVDVITCREVGDGAGDLEDAVVGARGAAQAFDGLFDQFVVGVVQAALFFDLTVFEQDVGFAAVGLDEAPRHPMLWVLSRAHPAVDCIRIHIGYCLGWPSAGGGVSGVAIESLQLHGWH